jgi:hypothetical protein
MSSALNLAALACTVRQWLNESHVDFEERANGIVLTCIELDHGSRLLRPQLREYPLKQPATIYEACDAFVQVGIVPDTREDREDFFASYQAWG